MRNEREEQGESVQSKTKAHEVWAQGTRRSGTQAVSTWGTARVQDSSVHPRIPSIAEEKLVKMRFRCRDVLREVASGTWIQTMKETQWICAHDTALNSLQRLHYTLHTCLHAPGPTRLSSAFVSLMLRPHDFEQAPVITGTSKWWTLIFHFW